MNNVKVSFLLRTNKVNSDGKCPIYLRLTVNQRRAEISTKKYVNPTKWKPQAQRVKGNTPDANSMNSYLEQFKRKALEAETKLLKEGSIITAKKLKEVLVGKAEQEVELFEFFEKHNSEMLELLGKDYTKATHTRYTTCLSHLKDFVKLHYDQNYFLMKSIDLAFIQSFEHYLKTKNNSCSHNTALKYISQFKKIVRRALALDLILKNPFRSYNQSLRTVDPKYLAFDELKLLQEKTLEIDRVDRVRNIFLFSCYTGLSYSDVEKLKKSDIESDSKGDKWLVVNRQKTKEASYIYLLKYPLTIIEKYKDDPETGDGNLLPLISNQKMNAYLKEIAAICGISKNLTFHMARHTFATTVALENGVSESSVQKILGHKDPRSTKHYARVTKRKVGNEMRKLNNSLI